MKAIDDATFSPDVSVAGWRDAVRAAGVDLVNARAVGPGYVDEMVRLIDDAGPWCVLAPGVAVPHARPSALVRRDAVAIVTLREPVRFGHPHHDPVGVVIGIASTSIARHIRLLAHLATVLDRRGVDAALIGARSRSEALDVLTEVS